MKIEFNEEELSLIKEALYRFWFKNRKSQLYRNLYDKLSSFLRNKKMENSNGKQPS